MCQKCTGIDVLLFKAPYLSSCFYSNLEKKTEKLVCFKESNEWSIYFFHLHGHVKKDMVALKRCCSFIYIYYFECTHNFRKKLQIFWPWCGFLGLQAIKQERLAIY